MRRVHSLLVSAPRPDTGPRSAGSHSMKKGFYWIMAAQFFSSLADNALLIAAIALLVQMQ